MGLITPVSLFNKPTSNPISVSGIMDIAVDASSNYYLVGNFSTINGEPRTNMAKINVLQELDATFTPTSDYAVFSCSIYDTSIYVGGDFEQINGDGDYYSFGKLSTANGSGVDRMWLCKPNSRPLKVLADPATSDVFIGGYFNQVSLTPRLHIAKSDSSGNAIAAFQANTNGNYVNDMVINKSDTSLMYICGDFTTVRGVSRRKIARINKTTGIVDTSFNANSTISTTFVPINIDSFSNGRPLVVGYFTSGGLPSMYNAYRFTTDGTGTTVYTPGALPNTITYGIVDPSDRVILATYRTDTLEGRITKYIDDGTIDTSFGTGGSIILDGRVTIIRNDNSGGYVIAGTFTDIDGTSRNGFAVLSSTGVVL